MFGFANKLEIFAESRFDVQKLVSCVKGLKQLTSLHLQGVCFWQFVWFLCVVVCLVSVCGKLES